MIVNNFHAMRFVSHRANAKLTPDLVFELHRLVTADTFDDPRKAGCFRTEADDIVVEDEMGTLLHRPPVASELEERMRLMCDFANDRPGDRFIHPVLMAIMLHFWVGYDHVGDSTGDFRSSDISREESRRGTSDRGAPAEDRTPSDLGTRLAGLGDGE